jgi:hypothetical protein
MTARNGVDVTTAAAAVRALAIATVVADLRRVVTALVAVPHVVMALVDRVAMGLAVDSVHGVKVDRVAMAMIAVDRAVLATVTVADRRSASGWRFRRTCR